MTLTDKGQEFCSSENKVEVGPAESAVGFQNTENQIKLWPMNMNRRLHLIFWVHVGKDIIMKRRNK